MLGLILQPLNSIAFCVTKQIFKKLYTLETQEKN